MSLLLSLGPVMQQVTGVTPTFFGSIGMNREFWAEDPSWSNPGDGNSLTTVRDNGALAADLTAATVGGGTGPTFKAASSINSKPAFRFNASSQTVGGYLSTSSGTPSGFHSIVMVARLLSNTWSVHRFTDTQTGANRSIIEKIDSTSDNFRTFFSSTVICLSSNGVANTNAHVHTAKFSTDASTYDVDNVSVATDTSGTVSGTISGWVVGAGQGLNACVHGDIAYLAQYDGSITALGSTYTDWLANIMAYYGL